MSSILASNLRPNSLPLFSCDANTIGWPIGANSLTFLIPAEIFPTTYRCFCHGISAAAGKIGSIIAVLMIYGIKNQYDAVNKQGLIFLLFAGIGAVGAFFSWAYLPDIGRRSAEGKLVNRTLEELGEGARRAVMEGQTFGAREKWSDFCSRVRTFGVNRNGSNTTSVNVDDGTTR